MLPLRGGNNFKGHPPSRILVPLKSVRDFRKTFCTPFNRPFSLVYFVLLIQITILRRFDPLSCQSRSQSFVSLDQRSENESFESSHFRHAPQHAIACHKCRLRLRSRPDNQNSVISYCYFKWMRPELSFSDRWSRGSKLWERDCCLVH